MAYFTQEFINFFSELAQNNEKAWFDENRKRYETNIREPFKALVEEMIIRIHADDANVMITPKEAIFRINRDIRFSKDKRPYKTNVSAVISPVGKKDRSNPGFYFELSPQRIFIAGGAYDPDKEQLMRIRKYIAEKPQLFHKAFQDEAFQEKYGAILGTQNKRLPAELKSVAEDLPILYNKQFYYAAELPPKSILAEDLGDQLMDYYLASRAMMNYLRAAMQYRG